MTNYGIVDSFKSLIRKIDKDPAMQAEQLRVAILEELANKGKTEDEDETKTPRPTILKEKPKPKF